jgi:hypothetical protein
VALRFRKSFKIIPGIRLNLTTGGLSATLGPRGASIGVGARGVYGNVGIPGTGLSIRTRLDGGSRSQARSSYRAAMQELRLADREATKAQARAEHVESEERFARLQQVLATRVRQPLDWRDMTTPIEFVPRPFQPSEPAFSRETVAKEVENEFAPWPGILGLVIGAILVAAIGYSFFQLLGVVGLVGGGLLLLHAFRGRKRAIPERLAALQTRHRREVERLSTLHAHEERQRQVVVENHNALVPKFTNLLERPDPAILAELLEAELSNEDLPVPLVFDLELDDAERAAIELSLPDLDVVPAERVSLTKTGRASTKKVAQRDRTALYADLCAALALRLIHETYRVLPMVRSVEVFGTAEDLDPGTGQPREFVALHVEASRERFSPLNLDGVDPTEAIEGLGGAFAYTRTGELRPLKGITGLRT